MPRSVSVACSQLLYVCFFLPISSLQPLSESWGGGGGTLKPSAPSTLICSDGKRVSHTKTIHMHSHRALTLKGTLSWCFCVVFPFCALESLCLISNRFKVIFRWILVLYFQSSQQNDKWHLSGSIFFGVLYPTPPNEVFYLTETELYVWFCFFYLTFNTASGCQNNR